LIVRVLELEVPPYVKSDVTTVTVAVPAAAMSAAGMSAVNWVADTKCVVRSTPFHLTVDPLTKRLPVMVRVKAAPTAVRAVGAMLEIAGTGGLPFVKVWALEVPPPGVVLNTVTAADPAVAMSAAVIAAVSCVSETNVVVWFTPFHFTTDPLTKSVPLTVSVNAAPPALAAAGLRLVVAGTGLFIVKVRATEVPPPGAGVNTVTCAVPAAAMSAAVIVAVNWVALT
jgi:hypothetical protein